ncbi:MAG TPA: hydroxymethylbilane synthase [Dermatophilaceae bacterium]|jgi:hydroxymethylbilane synthase|nr:hydroxymethylbilane synthase [Dermatophilaceae bacterium]HMT89540.1 hydroxymethylbilane synthase [Dermatophilaceae bacterium]
MLRLGTRASVLARTQSGQVAAAVTALTGMPCELLPIRSEGDDTRIPLDAPPRPGAFVATLRDALLEDRVDLVVHSYKDLPSAPVPGLVVAAVPERAPAEDVLVAREGLTLAQLPVGARVGTSSPRRSAALLRWRPDLVIVPVRGNIDTRISLAHNGTVDAVVLALAGLHRVGRAAEATEVFALTDLVPAPAQGALAVECRSDSPLAATLAALDHLPSRLEVVAERAVLEGIEAACTTAVGARATWSPQRLDLVAEISDHRGVGYASRYAVVDLPASDPVESRATAYELGCAVADALLQGTP